MDVYNRAEVIAAVKSALASGAETYDSLITRMCNVHWTAEDRALAFEARELCDQADDDRREAAEAEQARDASYGGSPGISDEDAAIAWLGLTGKYPLNKFELELGRDRIRRAREP